MDIITRKGLEHWSGRKAPPELSMVVDGRVVTWAEVMEQRRERQRLRLTEKLRCEQWRAAQLIVADYGSGLMGGWQTMICWIGGRCWVERDGHFFIDQLMELYPVVLPFSHRLQWWRIWKREFAIRYRKRRQYGEPVGVAFLWKLGERLALKPCR